MRSRLPFDWLNYLELAKELNEEVESRWERLSEAVKRTIVSRAYYSAFCYIRNYEHKHRNLKIKHKPEDHQNLIEHLKKIGRNEIANKLSNLRTIRNNCDYDDVVENIDETVEGALVDAEELLQAYREL
jgi:uncharacterized protein (UPF0332 family)